MKRQTAVILFLLAGLILNAGCASINDGRIVIKKLLLDLKPYRISQTYYIKATRKKTYVRASVSFVKFDDGSALSISPEKITFNGTEMLKTDTDSGYDYNSPCPEKPQKTDTELIITPSGGDVLDRPKISDFFLELEGYKNENEIAYENDRHEPITFKIVFEPVEFASDGILRLSLSKDNVIQLKGKGREKTDFLEYYFQEEYSFTTNKNKNGLMSYDSEKHILTVPGAALKKWKVNDKKVLVLTNKDEGYIKVPDMTPVSSYNLTYNDERCVQIVD